MLLKSSLAAFFNLTGKGGIMGESVGAGPHYSAGNPVNKENLLCAGHHARYKGKRNLMSSEPSVGRVHLESELSLSCSYTQEVALPLPFHLRSLYLKYKINMS